MDKLKLTPEQQLAFDGFPTEPIFTDTGFYIGRVTA